MQLVEAAFGQVFGVALGDDKRLWNFHNTRLHELDMIAAEGLQRQQGDISKTSDFNFALPDAD